MAVHVRLFPDIVGWFGGTAVMMLVTNTTIILPEPGVHEAFENDEASVASEISWLPRSTKEIAIPQLYYGFRP